MSIPAESKTNNLLIETSVNNSVMCIQSRGISSGPTKTPSSANNAGMAGSLNQVKSNPILCVLTVAGSLFACNLTSLSQYKLLPVAIKSALKLKITFSLQKYLSRRFLKVPQTSHLANDSKYLLL